MRSRTKIILFILVAWVLLIGVTLVASRSIFISGFEKLEAELAAGSSNRSYHVALSTLNYIYLQNQDNAIWDDAYNYIQNRNSHFIEDNYQPNFFINSQINYLILLDKEGKLVWGQAYDLVKKHYVQIEPEVLNFFQKNAPSILKHEKQYYKIVPVVPGAEGFFQLSDNTISYFSLNWITTTLQNKPPNGIMIYGKKMTKAYEKQLGSVLSYPITLVSLKKMTQSPENKKIINHLVKNNNAGYAVAVNKNIISSYKLIKDFTNQIIAVARIDLPRQIYNEGKHSIFENQLILLLFTLLGAVGMSVLVYLFFRKQDSITRSFERFVPHELIDLLCKRDILDVSLGDNSKRFLSVLFLDIRDFTSISEKLSSQENFDLINALLRKIAPLISYNNGFIDKYIGDAIMALFPLENTHADDAVNAAKMIVDELDRLNNNGELKVAFPLRIGIGINTGETMLGIIGAKDRLEGTVISDMVNTASRIQSLTKTYGSDILISDQCYKAMQHPEKFDIQHVDDVLVKGKSTNVSVYSVAHKSS